MLKSKKKTPADCRDSSDLRLCNFGPNCDQIAGFSSLGQGINKEEFSASQKNLLILILTNKNTPPPTKYQFTNFHANKNFIFTFLAAVITVVPF